MKNWVLLYTLFSLALYVEEINGSIYWTNKTDGIRQLSDLCTEQHVGISLVCDPDNVLSKSELRVLQVSMDIGLSFTACFCGPACHSDAASATRRLVLGAIMLKRLPPQYESGDELVKQLHDELSLGSCSGNDILMLKIGGKIYVSYGTLAAKHLSLCMQRLPGSFNTSPRPVKRLRYLSAMYKTLLFRSCPCGACGSSNLLFKVTAMLLACLFLYSWFTLLARRARGDWTSPLGLARRRNQTACQHSTWYPFGDWTNPIGHVDSLLPPLSRRRRSCPPVSRQSSEAVQPPVPVGFLPPPPYASLVKANESSSSSAATDAAAATSVEPQLDLPPSYRDVLEQAQPETATTAAPNGAGSHVPDTDTIPSHPSNVPSRC